MASWRLQRDIEKWDLNLNQVSLTREIFENLMADFWGLDLEKQTLF